MWLDHRNHAKRKAVLNLCSKESTCHCPKSIRCRSLASFTQACPKYKETAVSRLSSAALRKDSTLLCPSVPTGEDNPTELRHPHATGISSWPESQHNSNLIVQQGQPTTPTPDLLHNPNYVNCLLFKKFER